MPGRSLISLTSMTFCFFRASFLLLLLLVFELAEIEDLADRRIGVRAISTRSRPAAIGAAAEPRARASRPRASRRARRPGARCGERISSLTRGPSRVGGAGMGGSGYAVLSCQLYDSGDSCAKARTPTPRGLTPSAKLAGQERPVRPRHCRSGGVASGCKSSDGLGQRKNFLLFAAQAAERHGARSPPRACPTTSSTGTLARLCSRTLELIFSFGDRSRRAARPPRSAAAHLLGIVVGVGGDGRAPSPAPAPARAGSGRRSARSGCR